MSQFVWHKKDLPDAVCYVLSNDTFMSYSPFSRGINTIILPCDSLKEAYKVVANIAARRTDQKYVRICAYHKPRLRFTNHHTYSIFESKQDASSFYKD